MICTRRGMTEHGTRTHACQGVGEDEVALLVPHVVAPSQQSRYARSKAFLDWRSRSLKSW